MGVFEQYIIIPFDYAVEYITAMQLCMYPSPYEYEFCRFI